MSCLKYRVKYLESSLALIVRNSILFFLLNFCFTFCFSATLELENSVKNLFPTCNNYEYWKKVDRQALGWVEHSVKESKDYKPEQIFASDYIKGVNENSRQSVMQIQQRKKRLLIDLTFTQCLDYSDDRLILIGDLIWSIVEETSWNTPAFLFNKVEREYILPSGPVRRVDIHSSETAKALALSIYFLGNDLERIYPGISARVLNSLQSRFFSSVDNILLQARTLSSQKVSLSNRFSWIASNWMLTSLLLLEGEQLRNNISKSEELLKLYFDSQPEDGSILEGVVYWEAGVGKLFDSIVILEYLGHDNLLNDFVKFNNILLFPAHLQMTSKFFLNYSDSDMRIRFSSARLFAMAKRLKREEFTQFFCSQKNLINPYHKKYGSFELFLYQIFLAIEYSEINCLGFKEKRDALNNIWFPDGQIFISKYTGVEGLTFALKGGANSGHHNHMDVGTFYLFTGDTPLIVEPGRGQYDLRMEGLDIDRYQEYEFTKSENHNIPVLHSLQQTYTSDPVKVLELDINSAYAKLDLTRSYPKIENLSHINREVSRLTKEEILLVDTLSTNGEHVPYEVSFLTPVEIDNIRIVNNMLSFESISENVRLKLQISKNLTVVEVIEFEIDELMSLSFPNGLRQIKLKSLLNESKKNILEEKYTFKFGLTIKAD